MAGPPFNIDKTSPSASSIISTYPTNEQAHRAMLEDWLSFISDPTTGLIRADALPPGATGIFPPGTVMLFVQSAAPTGWTKLTEHNDKALRIVSGTAGSGGSVAFTTAMNAAVTVSNTAATGTIGNTTATGTVGDTTLTISQIPSHNHTVNPPSTTTSSAGGHTHEGKMKFGTCNDGVIRMGISRCGLTEEVSGGDIMNTAGAHTHTVDIAQFNSGSAGGGGPHTHSFTGTPHNHTFTGSNHNHTFNLNVAYVDVILAEKDEEEPEEE